MHQQAFDILKERFAARIILFPVNLKETFQLYTDASVLAIGACLKQGVKIIDFFQSKAQTS